MEIPLGRIYYNYYHVEGRYDPEEPYYCSRWEAYEETDEEIRSHNYDGDSEIYQIFCELVDFYGRLGARNRAMYRQADEAVRAITEKYKGKAYRKYTEEGRAAMRDREIRATLFGNIAIPGEGTEEMVVETDPHVTGLKDPHVTGLKDPHWHRSTNGLYYYSEGWSWDEKAEKDRAFNREAINQQIQGIFSHAGVDESAWKGRSLILLIDPYHNKVSVSGVDDPEEQRKMEEALNQGRNVEQLFIYLYNGMYVDVRRPIRSKFNLYSMYRDITGEDAYTCRWTKDGIVNAQGRRISDVFREALKTTDKVPERFKEDYWDGWLFEYQKVFANGPGVPDLYLSVGFTDGQLQAMPNELMRKARFSALA